MTTLEILNNVFREVFEDNEIQITSDTTANDIEAWDSLSHITLILAIELKFDIEFSSGEIRSFANAGEMLKSIESKIK